MADSFPRELQELATETGCGPQIVQDLYQDQVELLQRDARVRTYIRVIAIKRVRDVLRRTESHHAN